MVQSNHHPFCFGPYYRVLATRRHRDIWLGYDDVGVVLPTSRLGALEPSVAVILRKYGYQLGSWRHRDEFLGRFGSGRLCLTEGGYYEPLSPRDAATLFPGDSNSRNAKMLWCTDHCQTRTPLGILQVGDKVVLELMPHKFPGILFDASAPHAPLEKAIWALGRQHGFSPPPC